MQSGNCCVLCKVTDLNIHYCTTWASTPHSCHSKLGARHFWSSASSGSCFLYLVIRHLDLKEMGSEHNLVLVVLICDLKVEVRKLCIFFVCCPFRWQPRWETSPTWTAPLRSSTLLCMASEAGNAPLTMEVSHRHARHANTTVEQLLQVADLTLSWFWLFYST